MDMYAEVLLNLPVKKSFTYRVSSKTRCEKGFRVQVPFRNRELKGCVIGVSASAASEGYEIKEVTRVLDTEPVFDDKLISLARWTARMYMCSAGEALSAMLPGGKKENVFDVDSEPDDIGKGEITLAKEQKEALDTISRGGHDYYYLYGVTGSGKTEVFLRAAEEVIKRGQGVIYLVPEISLTHQIISVVKERFGSEAAVLHSGLTPSRKLAEWMRIIRTESRFVVGVRSAVFAPIANLGLVIIDEEHEGSYKSGRTPRYHARQIAMRRCLKDGAALVMGSATPSAEAYHLMNSGRIKRLDLPNRLSGGGMPSLSVVDMKKEKGPISKRLEEEIRTVSSEGYQAILFLNRRGFSYFFHCRTCGYEMTCNHCSVSLTYHKSKHRMICHYCGYSIKPVSVCPECGSLDVGYAGFGTEKIEGEIGALFPSLTIARLDTDTASKRGVVKKTLTDFREGRIDILLGTQMVAKGLNFPRVKLVGIILADTGLQLPDFRASERTFSLIVQVSGRAGRYLPDGKVVVQTFRPENEAINYAVNGKIETFYEKELKIREALSFPPFTRLFRLVFRSQDQAAALKAAESFSKKLLPLLAGNGKILGPAECPLALVSRNYRFQLIVRSFDFSKTHSAIAHTLLLLDGKTRVYIEADVDPVSLL